MKLGTIVVLDKPPSLLISGSKGSGSGFGFWGLGYVRVYCLGFEPLRLVFTVRIWVGVGVGNGMVWG